MVLREKIKVGDHRCSPRLPWWAWCVVKGSERKWESTDVLHVCRGGHGASSRAPRGVGPTSAQGNIVKTQKSIYIKELKKQ
jgi:hypothetical protein